MSNPALNRLLRTGGLGEFHVGRDGAVAVSRRNDPYTMFVGETYHARFSAAEMDHKKEYQKKENREESGGKKDKKRKKDGDDSDSDSDGGDGPHFKSDGIHAKGSDADGDRKKNEKRKAGKKGKGPWDDKDGDGKPNKVDKD